MEASNSVEITTKPAEAVAGKNWLREIVAVAARWVLGGVFLYMGLAKVVHPEDFLKLVREYEIVSNPYVLNVIAAALPWFEIFCGALLIAGVGVRGTALVAAGLLLPFSAMVFKRALAIASHGGSPFCSIRFDCGCGNGEVLICYKLIENCALLFVAVWLMTGYGKRLSLRFNLV
jgi:uncharacterized membrane protein YphA (DoxX/SURF4 family)